jgi:hypothetical protein
MSAAEPWITELMQPRSAALRSPNWTEGVRTNQIDSSITTYIGGLDLGEGALAVKDGLHKPVFCAHTDACSLEPRHPWVPVRSS